MSAPPNDRNEILTDDEIRHVADLAESSGQLPLKLIAVETLARKIWPRAHRCEVKQSDRFRWRDLPGEHSAWAVVARFSDGRFPEVVKALTLEEVEAKLGNLLTAKQSRGS